MAKILNVMGSVSPNNVSATAKRISAYFPSHDIHTGVFGDHQEEVQSKFEDEGIETKFLGSATGAGQIRAALMSGFIGESFDLYHVFGGPLLHAPVLQLAHHANGTPIINRFNGYNNPEQHISSIVAKLIEKELLRQSNALVFNSHYQMTDILREHGMSPGSRHHVIEPGIDDSKFHRVPNNEITPLKNSMEIPEDAFVLGTCQTPRPAKRPRKAIDLIRKLNDLDEAQPFHMVIVGESAHVPQYKGYSREIGVDDYIHWVGYKPHSKLARWYSLFDVTFLTSAYESFGMSISESLLCQTPCVAFMTGGMAHQIEHGENGWLVRPGDIDMMSKRILDLAQNDNKRTRFGKAGREHVIERFTLSHASSKYQDLTQRVL
jgi:glycosyltransferase involved in cell wall biosynthesis